MSKTPKYQIKASKTFYDKMKKAGFVKVSFWIKPEWKDKIKETIKQLTRSN